MRMALFVEALERTCKLDVVVIPVAGSVPFGTKFGPDTNISIWEAKPETRFRLLSQIGDEQQCLIAFRNYQKPSLSASISEPILFQMEKLIEKNRYSLIHVARSYMLPILEAINAEVPVSVDLDEDDYASTMRTARFAENPSFDGCASRATEEARAFDRMITRYRDRFAVCIVSNELDRSSLKARHPGLDISVVPNGVAIPRLAPKRDDGHSIGFIGSLSYWPNLDGLQWFCDYVLPRIRLRSATGCHLYIAGVNNPASIPRRPTGPCVTYLGKVADVGTFYRTITVAVAPMRMGGGLRTKVVEAGAHRTAYVSFEDNVPRSHLKGRPAGWIARSAAGFAEACLEALQDAADRKKRANEGRRIACALYDREKIISELSRHILVAG